MKYINKQKPFESCDRQERPQFLAMEPLRPANLACYPASSALRPALHRLDPVPYWLHWLQSGGNLDFIVLALCSFVLTLSCHQASVVAVVPESADKTPEIPAPAAQPGEIDFALKAGLFTTSPKIQQPEDSENS